MTTIREAYKQNVINLVKHHKEHCHDEDCNISLMMIRMMLGEAGYEFTKEETALFW